MEQIKRLDLVGREALIFYVDDDKNSTCFGKIQIWDDNFIQVKTGINVQIIPNRLILKIKFRKGELDEVGEVLAKKSTKKVREDGLKAII